MDYKGKLYGKVGKTYFPMIKDTDYFDAIEKELKQAKQITEIEKLEGILLALNRAKDLDIQTVFDEIKQVHSKLINELKIKP